MWGVHLYGVCCKYSQLLPWINTGSSHTHIEFFCRKDKAHAFQICRCFTQILENILPGLTLHYFFTRRIDSPLALTLLLAAFKVYLLSFFPKLKFLSMRYRWDPLYLSALPIYPKTFVSALFLTFLHFRRPAAQSSAYLTSHISTFNF